VIDPQRMAIELADRLRIVANKMRAALNAIDVEQPGWPTASAGAAPSNNGHSPDSDDGPSSATERAALQPDRARADEKRLRTLLAAGDNLTRDLYNLVTFWASVATPTDAREIAAARTTEADWCESCWRDSKYREPLDSGRLCGWCAVWKRQYGTLPPLVLLVRRHAGYRITQADVDRALRNGNFKTGVRR